MSQQQTEASSPTPNQILEARFEAVKVVLSVAERVLLADYERSIIIQAALMSAKGLQEEYKRANGAGDEATEDEPVKVDFDEDEGAEGEAE
jgi:hypothetical protein